MIIQASHMNLGVMQELRSGGRSGTGAGQDVASLAEQETSRLASGLAVSNDIRPGHLPADAPDTLGRTTANEIIRRMEAVTPAVKDGIAEVISPKDDASLRDSLGAALDWVRNSFGDETGAAASGMMLAATAETVSEETLGQGLLDVLRFIDRTQGFAAGDQAIARFNSGINGQLNAYFDNGKSETFMAVQSGSDGSEATRLFLRSAATATAATKATPDPTAQLLDALRQDLEESAGLQSLAEQLRSAQGPARTSAAMAAYTAPVQTSSPQFMNLSV
jgi:hypothetical protein